MQRWHFSLEMALPPQLGPNGNSTIYIKLKRQYVSMEAMQLHITSLPVISLLYIRLQ